MAQRWKAAGDSLLVIFGVQEGKEDVAYWQVADPRPVRGAGAVW